MLSKFSAKLASEPLTAEEMRFMGWWISLQLREDCPAPPVTIFSFMTEELAELFREAVQPVLAELDIRAGIHSFTYIVDDTTPDKDSRVFFVLLATAQKEQYSARWMAEFIEREANIFYRLANETDSFEQAYNQFYAQFNAKYVK